MGDDHRHAISDIALRVKALESLLIEKGLVDPDSLDLLIDRYENKVGPRNGARVVAKASSYARRDTKVSELCLFWKTTVEVIDTLIGERYFVPRGFEPGDASPSFRTAQRRRTEQGDAPTVHRLRLEGGR